MPLPFSGPGLKLTPADITAAAQKIGCLREAVIACSTVETGAAGGYLSDGTGRPCILFEAKRFGDATSHRYDAAYPTISCGVQNWKLYVGGAAEYTRLARAMELNAAAAVASTSWGMFQILGSNALSLGYPSVDAFVAEMVSSEGAQLDAFVRFVRINHLDEALAGLDWATFARGYNGPAYQANSYDTKLAAAFQAAAGKPPAPGVLRMGQSGPNVSALQARLTNVGYPCGVIDGLFGRATELAVRRFQSMMGLTVDGIAGPATLNLIGVPK